MKRVLSSGLNLFMLSYSTLIGSLQPMRYNDIVTMERLVVVAVSDKEVAFVTRRGNIQENRNLDSLYLWSAEEGIQKKLCEWDVIEKIVWQKGTLYGLGEKGACHQIFKLESDHSLVSLLSPPTEIGAFTLDAYKSCLYYTQTQVTPPSLIQQWKEEGYVYQWGKDNSRSIMIERQYEHREWEEIWCLDMSTGQSHLIARLPYSHWPFGDSLITDLQISSDSKSLAILANRLGNHDQGESARCRELWILDCEDKTLNKVDSSLKTIQNPLQINAQEWVFQRADQSDTLEAKIVEDSNTPSQLVVREKETGKILFTTSLNSYLNQVSRGYVESFTVPVDDHLSAKGYLIHPVQKEAGKRYPLIIATYGFSGKKFIAEAEWHSTFPAQVLANEGYYILLLNHLGLAQNLVGDPEKARQIEGWNVLKAFEQAVALLDQQGFINPNQVGLYGWSHGAFIVQFLISHSDKFQVASIGEGSDYGPIAFCLVGTKYMTKICDNIYGGPPWGETLKNYLDFATLFRIDQIKTPLLMEFTTEGGLGGLEIYTPLRYLGIPAELVLYEGEEHNFVKPKARLASMARKVDWFNYWLLGKCNPDHPEQSARWSTL